MSRLRDEAQLTEAVVEEAAASLAPLGGVLYCSHCHGTKPVPGADGLARYLRSGWPQHCGRTMAWYTQRQIDAGELPSDAWPLS